MLRCILAPCRSIVPDDEAVRCAHAGAFDLAEEHRVAENAAGVTGRHAGLHPAHGLLRKAMAGVMLSSLGRVLPDELPVIGASVRIKLEVACRHLDEALHRVHAGACGQKLGDAGSGKAVQHQLRRTYTLQIADAHQQRLGPLHAQRIDQLRPQRTKYLRLDQHHALVVEPDASVAEGKEQRMCQIIQRWRGGSGQLAEGPAPDHPARAG